MFREDKGECDWEDQVDCKGKEKLIGKPNQFLNKIEFKYSYFINFS